MKNKHNGSRENELFTIVVNLATTAVVILVSVFLSLALAYLLDGGLDQFSKSFSGAGKKEKKLRHFQWQ